MDVPVFGFYYIAGIYFNNKNKILSINVEKLLVKSVQF